MSEIPPEGQAIIEECKRQQATVEAARPPHKKRKEIKVEEASQAKLKPMGADEVIGLATNLGWRLTTKGEHRKLVKGKLKVSVPIHGGSGQTLATGTLRNILKKITG